MIEAEVVDAAVLDVNLNGEQSYPVADALCTRCALCLFDGLQQERPSKRLPGFSHAAEAI